MPIESMNGEASLEVQKQKIFLNRKVESRSWHSGIFGYVNFQRNKKLIKHPRGTLLNDEELLGHDVITIQPTFLGFSFSMDFVTGTRFIPRTLSVYRTTSYLDPIFTYVSEGDLDALQLALHSGRASPFVTDEQGDTLLHVRPSR